MRFALIEHLLLFVSSSLHVSPVLVPDKGLRLHYPLNVANVCLQNTCLTFDQHMFNFTVLGYEFFRFKSDKEC